MPLKRRLVKFYIEIISGYRRGFLACFIRGLLQALSYVYGSVVSIRHFLYREKFIKTYRSKAFVISVGNCVVGGTGKTPFVEYLYRLLDKKDVVVLMRGYGSKAAKSRIPRELSQDEDVAEVGDEALLLKRRGVPVIVGACRKKSCQLAESLGYNTVILDDGMQQLQLQQDLSICLIDSLNPFGYGAIIPRGLLRDYVSRLKTQSLLVITRAKGDTKDLEQELKKLSGCPVVKTRLMVDGIFDPEGNRVDLAHNTKVALFCGIGQPIAFYNTIRDLGFTVVARKELLDHEGISANELSALRHEALQKGASVIICTEKDILKLSRHEKNLYYVRIHTDVDGEDVKALIKRAKVVKEPS